MHEFARQAGGRVERHKLVDRIYHWVMAVSILTLMATAFLPILGWKFEWLTIHWITGLVLTVAVVFHIIRSLFFQKLMNMVPDGKDIASLRMGPGPANTIWRRNSITWRWRCWSSAASARAF